MGLVAPALRDSYCAYSSPASDRRSAGMKSSKYFEGLLDDNFLLRGREQRAYDTDTRTELTPPRRERCGWLHVDCSEQRQRNFSHAVHYCVLLIYTSL